MRGGQGPPSRESPHLAVWRVDCHPGISRLQLSRNGNQATLSACRTAEMLLESRPPLPKPSCGLFQLAGEQVQDGIALFPWQESGTKVIFEVLLFRQQWAASIRNDKAFYMCAKRSVSSTPAAAFGGQAWRGRLGREASMRTQ